MIPEIGHFALIIGLCLALVLLAPLRRKKRFLRQLSGELKRAQDAPGKPGEVK
jgi:hypothetical protein